MSQSYMPSESGCLWGHKDVLGDKAVLHLDLLSSAQVVGGSLKSNRKERTLSQSPSLGAARRTQAMPSAEGGTKNGNKRLR